MPTITGSCLLLCPVSGHMPVVHVSRQAQLLAAEFFKHKHLPICILFAIRDAPKMHKAELRVLGRVDSDVVIEGFVVACVRA